MLDRRGSGCRYDTAPMLALSVSRLAGGFQPDAYGVHQGLSKPWCPEAIAALRDGPAVSAHHTRGAMGPSSVPRRVMQTRPGVRPVRRRSVAQIVERLTPGHPNSTPSFASALVHSGDVCCQAGWARVVVQGVDNDD